MKVKLLNTILPLCTAAMCIALTGCGGSKAKSDNADAPQKVRVAEAVTDSVVLYKTVPGVISSANMANVVARTNGKLLTQNYTGGQYVKQGQVLFTLESNSYRDAVHKAEASLATAQSQRDYYTQQLAAMRKAYEADAVSRMQVAQAESNLAQAEASVKTARASLSTARENLSHCTVTAPMSGYITESVIDVGNYVAGEGSAVTLATIYDNSSLQANFSISDSEYEKLIGRTGGLTDSIFRNVPLTFREKLRNNYTTDLYYASPSVDESTASIQFTGNLTNRDNELRDGMYVSVSLPYGVEPHAILVKDASLGSDQLG
ncbi:MAG: efflux RND transporter periplasmic adaptor subunit, partial [Paramuribaculum sp.]|nr:efflux RND transporter periplasmic adaptor subunit [Paramuribaculum sp.]